MSTPGGGGSSSSSTNRAGQSAGAENRQAAADATVDATVAAAETGKHLAVGAAETVSYPLKELYYRMADAVRNYFHPAEARNRGAACDKVVPTFQYDRDTKYPTN